MKTCCAIFLLLCVTQFVAGNTCGGNITGTASGRVTSPRHPLPYPKNIRCEWFITTTVGRGMQLEVTHLNNKELSPSGASGTCWDKLYLFKKTPSSNYSRFKELCASSVDELPSRFIDVAATSPPSVTKVAIVFTSDYARQLSGFSILYRALCDQAFDSASGEITSPGYPSNYPNDARCKFNIRTPPGTNVHLRFVEFNIHKTFLCVTDYVSVSSSVGGTGVGVTGVTPKKYCGDQIPNQLISDSNDMTLEFVSDGSFNRPGFRAVWTTVLPTTTSPTTTTPTTTTQTTRTPTTTTTTTRTPTTTTQTTTTQTTTAQTTTTPTTTTKQTTTPVVTIASSRSFTPTPTTPKTTTITNMQRNEKTTEGSTFGVPPLSELESGYTGTCSTTVSGKVCQRWDVNFPHEPKFRPEPSNHNYCRNPDGDPKGEWCYTVETTRWEYCAVKTCVTTPAPPTTTVTVTTTSTVIMTSPTLFPTTAPPIATTTTASTTDVVPNIFTAPTTSGTNSSEESATDAAVAVVGSRKSQPPWYIFLLIGLALLLVFVVLVVALVIRRRRRKRGSEIINDGVLFQPMIEDEYTERPRENTYVEIPFVTSELATSNGYVMANRRGSASSVDSVAEAKRNLFEDDPHAATSNGGGNTTENPYAMATDNAGLPPNGVAAPPQLSQVDDNPYQQIEYVRTEDMNEIKKGSGINLVAQGTSSVHTKKEKKKGLKKFFSKKKTEDKPESPLTKPRNPPKVPVRTTTVQKSPDSSPKTEAIRKPAVPPKQRPSIASTSQAPDVIDEVFDATAAANHYQSPASIKEKFASFSEDQGAEESAYAVPGEGSFRLVEEDHHQSSHEDNGVPEDEAATKSTTEAKKTPSRVPDSSFKVSIDPIAIDQMNGTAGVVENEQWYASPSSPVFDIVPPLYDHPNTLNERPSSGESYCSMSKVDTPKKATRKKKARGDKQKQGERESGLYMHMESQKGKAGIHYQNLTYEKQVPSKK